MTPDDFLRRAQAGAPAPADLGPALLALWQAAAGQWDAAHATAQNLKTPDGSWIHAHLHRAEGDLDNAAYWYARADKPRPPAATAIAAERVALTDHFLRAASA